MNLSTLFHTSNLLFPPLHSSPSTRSQRAGTSMTEDVAIEGKNLNFSVATKQGKLSPILQDCSLRIPSGELWRLFGPNGCGKFTLLKIDFGWSFESKKWYIVCEEVQEFPFPKSRSLG
ncbi:ABC transporter I family member 10-like isoform X1 [Tripterygium wilfordii]|uniref:ABC transporter I family member 10-like isoform X1 n=1 Tax=Tripterygium wilfordii TaxID=458696 RepID=UPI0018F80316|nr:ABC transporter I family member 10-like isoform X1 [Tripterygium wilfordii]